MPEYSVWYPATSSDSASGRSKGARLVSATAEIQKTMKETGIRKPYQTPDDSWRRTISTRSIDLARKATVRTVRPVGIS